MADESLTQEVLAALNKDPEVLWVKDLHPSGGKLIQTGTETYVIGCRDHGDPGRNKTLFVIALGDPEQQLNPESFRRLKDWKDTLTSTNRSATSGPWWGMASSVHTALRVSKGEVQFERKEL